MDHPSGRVTTAVVGSFAEMPHNPGKFNPTGRNFSRRLGFAQVGQRSNWTLRRTN